MEENISQEFRLKNIYERRNYFIEEINKNELMSKKHKKTCQTLLLLNYIEYLIQFLQLLDFCFCFFSSYAYRNCNCNN